MSGPTLRTRVTSRCSSEISAAQVGQVWTWKRSSSVPTCSPRASRLNSSGSVCIVEHRQSLSQLPETPTEVAPDLVGGQLQSLGDLGGGEALGEGQADHLLRYGRQVRQLVGDHQPIGQV